MLITAILLGLVIVISEGDSLPQWELRHKKAR